MDGANFSDLGQILYALKDNPQILQMLTAMMGAPKKSEAPPPMPDLMSLLGGIQKPPLSGEKSGSSSAENGFFGASSSNTVLGSPEENTRRINLLNAVRPYLSESRQAKVDTVIKLLKIAELGGLSKILGGK